MGGFLTRMDDVADAVGLNKATVYHYYASKSLILYDIYKGAADFTVDALHDDPSASARETIYHFTRRLLVGIAGNIERAAWLIKHAPKGFSIYSGDDGTAVALMLLGGHGNVSVTANVAPKLMHELCIAAIEGDTRKATALHMRLLSLHRERFCEPSPAPAKWALLRLGRCRPTVRLPITPLTASGQQRVDAALRDAGLI